MGASEKFSMLVYAFIFGFATYRLVSSQGQLSPQYVWPVRAPHSQLDDQQDSRGRATPAVFTIVVVLVIYHFAKVGAPIFAGDVETARYDIGGSGLFGVPSRMYLYGLPLLTAFAASEAATNTGVAVWRDRWVRACFIVLIASRALSGFKSGLLNVAIVAILIWALSRDDIRVSRYRGRIFAAIFVVLAAATGVATLYQSYDTSGRSLTASLENRLTEGSAAGPATLLTVSDEDMGVAESSVEIDFKYFGNRYLGVGAEEPFGFTRLLSARLNGEDPASSVFLAPVTMTGFAVAFYDLGYWSVVAMAAVGLATAFLCRRAQASFTRAPVRFMLLFGVVRMIGDYLAKGETVYTVLNWTLSIFFVGVLTSIVLWRSRQRQAHESPTNILVQNSRWTVV